MTIECSDFKSKNENIGDFRRFLSTKPNLCNNNVTSYVTFSQTYVGC